MLKFDDDMDIKNPIDSFCGEYEMCSNFYPSIIIFQNIEMPTVEHAFVAAKSIDREFWLKISKMHAKYAGKVKREGRKLEKKGLIREDWYDMNVFFMAEFIDQKFSQKPFREFLLATYPRYIVEGNNWHDNFWGNCTCPKCKNIVGENNLGILIMNKRKKLYEHISSG